LAAAGKIKQSKDSKSILNPIIH